MLFFCVGLTEVLASSNTCLNSFDGNFALNYKFNAPYSGILNGIRLVYNSGGMTCGTDTDVTNWGCHTHTQGDLILINLLNVASDETLAKNGVTLFPTGGDTEYVGNISSHSCGATLYTYSMFFYDINSDELVLHSSSTSYEISTNDSFILGWEEAICNTSTSDNSGTTCATAYLLYSDIYAPHPTSGMCLFCLLLSFFFVFFLSTCPTKSNCIFVWNFIVRS